MFASRCDSCSSLQNKFGCLFNFQRAIIGRSHNKKRPTLSADLKIMFNFAKMFSAIPQNVKFFKIDYFIFKELKKKKIAGFIASTGRECPQAKAGEIPEGKLRRHGIRLLRFVRTGLPSTSLRYSIPRPRAVSVDTVLDISLGFFHNDSRAGALGHPLRSRCRKNLKC